jgi:hypothetical protein
MKDIYVQNKKQNGELRNKFYNIDISFEEKCQHTHSRSWVLLEKLSIVQLLKNFLAFYGTESSLLCLQEPATGPYSEPDQSNPYHPILPL